jgi:hypothetical protein
VGKEVASQSKTGIVDQKINPDSLTLKFLADLVGGAWIGKVGFEGQTLHAVSSGQALR